MKKRLSLFTGVVAFLTLTFTLPVKAYTFLPDNIQRIFDLTGPQGTGTAGFITSRVATGLFFVLGILVLFGVVYSLMAAFKYIRSEGDPGKIEEAQKGIKAIFFGIAAMMIGIIGIVIVFVFFNAGKPDPTLMQTCLTSPQSLGCTSCKDEGEVFVANSKNMPSNLCSSCEAGFRAVAARGDVTLTNSNNVGTKVQTGWKSMSDFYKATTWPGLMAPALITSTTVDCFDPLYQP